MTMRTSETDPLRIDAVTYPAGYGRIGLTFCPGKLQSAGRSGHWARDLGRDHRGRAVNNESHSQMAGLVDTVAGGQRIQISSGISQHLINPSVMLHPVVRTARVEL